MRIGRTSLVELVVVALVWLLVPTLVVGWIWIACTGIAVAVGGLLLVAAYFTRSYP